MALCIAVRPYAPCSPHRKIYTPLIYTAAWRLIQVYIRTENSLSFCGRTHAVQRAFDELDVYPKSLLQQCDCMCLAEEIHSENATKETLAWRHASEESFCFRNSAVIKTCKHICFPYL